MLGEYVSTLNSMLAQLDDAVGVPMPSVTAARQSLSAAIGAHDPIELEKLLVEAEVAINAIAAGTQPAPNSILANMLMAVEQYRQMKQHIAEGRQVVWARERISINGTIHDVFTGAWPMVPNVVITERIQAAPKRATRQRRT